METLFQNFWKDAGSGKWQLSYSRAMNFVRTRLALAVLMATFRCVRGARRQFFSLSTDFGLAWVDFFHFSLNQHVRYIDKRFVIVNSLLSGSFLIKFSSLSSPTKIEELTEFARPWVRFPAGLRCVFSSDPAVSSSIFVGAETEEKLISGLRY